MRLPRLSRPLIGWVLVAIFAYGVFLLAYLPARIGADVLARASENRMMLARATGSVWSGQGELIVRTPGAAAVRIGQLSWDLRLLPLFLARLQIDTTLDGQGLGVRASITRTIRSVRLQSASAQIDTTALPALHPALAVANLQGQLRLDAPELTFSSNAITGDADIVWHNAGSGNFGLEQLGDYRAALRGAGATIQMQISTLKGDVQLDGQGTWEPLSSGRLQLALTAEPRARQATLEPLMQGWMKPAGNGRYRFDLVTNFRMPALN